MTPPGIDPGTVRLVAQRLNHCATPCPNKQCICSKCNYYARHYKGKGVPVHVVKAYVGRIGIAPPIPELGIRHVSSLLDVPVVLSPGKQLSAPNEYEACWISKHLWTRPRTEESLVP